MNDNNQDNNLHDILLIEDSLSHALIYTSYLTKVGLAVTHVDTGGAGLMYIKAHKPALVLLDLELPDIHGMSILKYITDNELPCVTVILTGHGTINMAVEAMQAGAFDFLSKPFDASRFNQTVNNALDHYHLNVKIWEHKYDVERYQYYSFIGYSDAMQMVYQMIDNVAQSNASVFICGESGTGKELCADAIHQSSPRKNKPFIALNCASIPKELMESEFFGHVKGAFTGAHNDRTGAVEQADGGTLFLDEICEMDLELQSKLLRFIQTGRYRKVGSSKETQVDIRFVCATNRSPLKEVTKGNFREDLYYRLHVIPINLPPLRDRGIDVVLIANYFLRKYAQLENKVSASFTPAAERVLLEYQWPGNVRQMQNVIRLIVVLNNTESIDVGQLPAPLNDPQLLMACQLDTERNLSASNRPIVEIKERLVNGAEIAVNNLNDQTVASITNEGNTANEGGITTNGHLVADAGGVDPLLVSQQGIDFGSKSKIEPFEIYEKRIIEAAILSCDGNVPEAAAQLALSPSTLYRKIQVWKSKKL